MDPVNLRLPQLLSPDRYCSVESHQREMAHLFEPAWHCIGLIDDIPKAGNYFTVEHLGKPLLVQNQGDRVVVFHNVCCHRNALLAWQPCGHMDRITCGYHGWEYDRDGVVCKIPGGEHFKAMKASEFVLDQARVATIGRLIFVTLDSQAPSLQDFLGDEMWRRLTYTFDAALSPVARWTVDYECNWKVLIENTLEDYHISSVHFATAGPTPPYEQIHHTLDEKFCTYENRAPNFDNGSSRWLARQMRRPNPEFTYYQYVSYPSLIFAASAVSGHLHLLVPTSPTTCRARIFLFLASGEGTIVGRALHKLMTRPATKIAKKFVEEDRVICNEVQRGLNNARFPAVLGRREERVHSFQQYVVRHTSNAAYAAV
jgi:choline monooxygenase